LIRSGLRRCFETRSGVEQGKFGEGSNCGV